MLSLSSYNHMLETTGGSGCLGHSSIVRGGKLGCTEQELTSHQHILLLPLFFTTLLFGVFD